VDIDNEITTVHNFVRDKYRSKFPELESLVMHPVDYSRVVKTIANEMVCMPQRNLSGPLDPLAPLVCQLGTTFR
jgi:RNA processing factor Prp31